MKELWVYLVNNLDELVPSKFLGFTMLCLVGLTVKGQPVFFKLMLENIHSCVDSALTLLMADSKCLSKEN